jgi:8-oxo-dGTP pyrophosphatase MutT (NUDIX family)
MPALPIVVRFGESVLMLFNGWRKQWELPDGMRYPGETPRQPARRELAEETGIGAVDLDFVAVAECDLQRPSRQEYTAIYRIDLQVAPVGGQRRGVSVLVVGSAVIGERADESTRRRDGETHCDVESLIRMEWGAGQDEWLVSQRWVSSCRNRLVSPAKPASLMPCRTTSICRCGPTLTIAADPEATD